MSSLQNLLPTSSSHDQSSSQRAAAFRRFAREEAARQFALRATRVAPPAVSTLVKILPGRPAAAL